MRFDKLELPGESPKQPRRDQPAVVERDEDHWLRQADEHRHQGNCENALRFYSRALEIDKSLVVAWVGQVQMLVQLQEYPQAELWARKALELFPANGDLLAGRSQAVCRMGDLRQAQKLSDGAMQQRGHSAYRWLARGELMVAGRQDSDQHCFAAAAQADRDWLVPLDAALIYLFYGRPSKALPQAQTAAEQAGTAYYAWYVLGRCQQELGFTTSARSSFGRCLELCPRHTEAGRRISELGGVAWKATLRRWLGRS